MSGKHDRSFHLQIHVADKEKADPKIGFFKNGSGDGTRSRMIAV